MNTDYEGLPLFFIRCYARGVILASKTISLDDNVVKSPNIIVSRFTQWSVVSHRVVSRLA